MTVLGTVTREKLADNLEAYIDDASKMPHDPRPFFRAIVAALREPMHIRDTFAAAALTGLLANASEVNDELAAEAFTAADAMLAARERKESENG
jgi:hypothetical protein